MKTLLRFGLLLGLCLTSWHGIAIADEPPAKTVPMKQVPTPGRFEIEVASGERVKSFEHPSKALSEIGRAVSRAKRAKEGEAPLFEAELTLNDQVFKFSDPEAALGACKAVTMAMRDLPKLRMGLGDLGEIPDFKPEDVPANQTSQPTGRSRKAAMAEVRRRIQVALRKQMVGRGGRPVIPNRAAMQQTIAQEIAKARKEGLLPAAPANQGVFAGGTDPREAKKEAIVQGLAFAFSQADSTKAAGAGDKPETQDDKPAPDKPETPKKPAEAKAPAADEK